MSETGEIGSAPNCGKRYKGENTNGKRGVGERGVRKSQVERFNKKED